MLNHFVFGKAEGTAAGKALSGRDVRLLRPFGPARCG